MGGGAMTQTGAFKGSIRRIRLSKSWASVEFTAIEHQTTSETHRRILGGIRESAWYDKEKSRISPLPSAPVALLSFSNKWALAG
jgi:hypothetical protein